MRPDGVNRPHPIEEDERTDHAPLGKRQQPTDLEPTEITRARFDHQFDYQFATVVIVIDRPAPPSISRACPVM